MIVKEIMTYALQILQVLGVGKGDPKPSGIEVLEAALELDEIDPYVKERIRMALKILRQLEGPQFKEIQSKAKAERRKVLATVEEAISGQSLPEQVRRLRVTARDKLSRRILSAQVLEQVADILEDGAGTIYSPDFSFYRTLRSGVSAKKKDAVDTIKDADAIGATAGGFVGTLIEPGGGTAACAAAGGAGASAGAAIGELINWLF